MMSDLVVIAFPVGVFGDPRVSEAGGRDASRRLA